MSHYTISRETWAGKLAWLAMEWGRAYEAWETHGQARAPSHRAGEALRKAADDALKAVVEHLLAGLGAAGMPACPESGKHCNWTEGECQTCGSAEDPPMELVGYFFTDDGDRWLRVDADYQDALALYRKRASGVGGAQD